MAKSIIQSDSTICAVCGQKIYGNKDAHHIFNGTANRTKSDEDGMILYLHHNCHMWLHDHPISMRTFKQRGQRKWEEEIGTRNQFIKRYGKSYL